MPNVTLEYKPGSVNRAANALSRALVSEALRLEVAEEEPIVSKIRSSQRSDSELNQLINYLEEKGITEDPSQARKVVTQAQKGYYLVYGVLYFENGDVTGRRHLVVPASLQQKLLSEHHETMFAGHFVPRKCIVGSANTTIRQE